MEVSYLEKYLLSMYRKTFATRLTSQCMMDESPKANSATEEQVPSEIRQFKTTINSVNAACSIPSEDSVGNLFKESGDILGAQILVDSSIGRSHSSLSQRSPIALRTNLLGTLAEAVDSYHSLPLSMLEVSKLMNILLLSANEIWSNCILKPVKQTMNFCTRNNTILMPAFSF